MTSSSFPFRRLGDLVSHSALGLNATKAGEGTTPIIRVSDLPHEVEFFGDETQLERRDIPPGRAKDRASLEPDDLVLVARGSQFRLAIANPGMEGVVIANNLMLIRTNPEVLMGPALGAWLGSPRGAHELAKVSRSSSVVMSLRTADVLELEVPVPPMEVQEYLTNLLFKSSLAYRETLAAAEMRRSLVFARCAEILGGAA